MSGHLDGPPPGPPDPPYIPGDLGAPSAEEFARRRASPTPEERNPYAPSADWKPGQDTFTSQAAGIWAEGFAAGRAAATPDPPERMFTFHTSSQSPARRVSCHNCDWRVEGDDPDLFAQADEHVCASPAASPDERLREALHEIVRQVKEYPARSPTGIMVRDDIAGMVDGTACLALAAADREAPEPLSLSDLRKVVPAPPVDPDGGKR